MADGVAIISVLSTAAVALGSAGITAKREHDRFASETRRDRENELREVADHAATHLSNAIWQLERGRTHLHDLRPLHEAVGQISNFEDRLAVRLGNDEQAVDSYRQAVEDIRAGLKVLEESVSRTKRCDDHDRSLTDIEAAALANKKAFRDFIAKRLSPDAR
jgi:hypothetical protein